MINLLNIAISSTNEGFIDVLLTYNERLESIIVHIVDSGKGTIAKTCEPLSSESSGKSTLTQGDKEISACFSTVQKIVKAFGGATTVF